MRWVPSVRFVGWIGLAGCPRPATPLAEPPAAFARTTVPEVILPHCLWGIDPHLARVTSDGGGYVLAIDGAHALSFAGFVDGDRVTGVSGWPLGTIVDWTAARAATAGDTSCWWEVERDGSLLRLAADRVPWPPPADSTLGADGVAVVSRSAVAVALTDPHRRQRPMAMPQRGGVVPAAHLRDVADVLGIPRSCRVVAVDEAPVASQVDLEAAAVALLDAPNTRWTCADGVVLDAVVTGPAVPVPRAGKP